MDKRTWMGLIVHEIKDQLESEFEVCDGPGAIVTCVGGGGLAIGKLSTVESRVLMLILCPSYFIITVPENLHNISRTFNGNGGCKMEFKSSACHNGN